MQIPRYIRALPFLCFAPTDRPSNSHVPLQGPLTTVFTPAPSCSTVYQDVAIGTFVSSTAANSSVSVQWYVPGSVCQPSPTTNDCLPSASAWATAAQYNVNDSTNTQVFPPLLYYSPAFYCPSGYATVGLATKSANGLVSSSGAIFSGATFSFETGVPQTTAANDELYDPFVNALLNVMAEGESAVVCCPR